MLLEVAESLLEWDLLVESAVDVRPNHEQGGILEGCLSGSWSF